ncbi:hypothetical protein [Embleya sp. NPDC005575]|uniref:DUF6919 domain-containing protein n=1 Tax=Embleya sp. NPDC005575 TaxID=3156892 RepID=UPI0033B9A9F9
MMRLPWMNRTDKRRWAAAATFGDLCDLTAGWLTGQVRSLPAYQPNRGPDDETTSLVPTLTAYCLGGYLTTWSQPGLTETIGGGLWEQRATVEGYVLDPGLCGRLVDAATAAGLVVVVHPPNGPAGGDPITVTTFDGEWYTSAGLPLGDDLMRAEWSIVSDPAFAELTSATHLTVIAPEFGPGGNRLWTVLHTAIEGEPVITHIRFVSDVDGIPTPFTATYKPTDDDQVHARAFVAACVADSGRRDLVVTENGTARRLR